ncbi:MAG: FAD binding domain-containing protein [Chloroflexota bacterium]
MAINAHPELPEFDYIRPSTLMEASRFLAQHPGEARPLLGGTDIFVRMRDGFWHDKYLVDVKKLDGTGELVFSPESGLTLGAALNMNQVIASAEVRAHYPLLAEACRSVASYQLRSRATIAGNICNASPAGDTIGACLVLGGMLKVHGTDGWRDIPLSTRMKSAFFLGPGKTLLQAGDIVTAIHFPPPPPTHTNGCAGTYIKLGRNTWSDLSIVGVTVFAYADATLPSGYSFHVALASVAPVPLLVPAVHAFLAENTPGAQAFEQAARLAQDACHPIDDVRGSARYRKAMVGKLTEKALVRTWSKLRILSVQR